TCKPNDAGTGCTGGVADARRVLNSGGQPYDDCFALRVAGTTQTGGGNSLIECEDLTPPTGLGWYFTTDYYHHNSGFTPSGSDDPKPTQTFDLQRTILHELGHILGLAHPSNAADRSLVS